jgi:hypothetical protein
MRGSRVLAAFGIAGLALVLVGVSISSASADASSVERDTAPLAPAATIVVTSTADSGPGTLRWALGTAAVSDTITFNTSVFPLGNPQTITLSSPLPDIITDALTIDASNAGVILDGSSTPTYTVGLVVSSASGVTIKGLQILNFPVHGVNLRNGATNNTIGGINGSPGGACSGDCNLISGNGGIGILLSGSGTMSNTVSGNYVGTDIGGTEGLGNYEGVRIDDGASGNVIGGDMPGKRNLISGNRDQGVSIHGSGTTSNTVSGNYIGTDVNGTAIISSTASKGFFIASGASYNLIGGSNGSPGGACTGGCNLISGYSEAGVSINWPGAMSNTVSGNYIGTNVTGTVALGNGSGVIIGHGATYNLIGGDSPAERNLISGNNEHGVAMYFSGTVSNTIAGNYIGTDPSGTTAVANGADGAHMNQASHNWVIGNLLSGNAGSGASLCCGSDTSYNAISGNTIGLDISGTAVISNGYSGVSIGGGPVNNLIGGDTPNERNLIGGNGEYGVRIDGDGTMSNTVSGNYIGTDIGGAVALGNGTTTGGWGVVIADGASRNTIGGTTAGERNLISGNGDLFCGPPGSAYAIGGGIRVYNMATGNKIQGNTIGMDVAGLTPIPNGMVGVGIEDSPGNLIGGTDPGAGNLISGNSCGGPPPPRAGIRLFGDGTTVQGNIIGLDANGADFSQVHSFYDNGDQGIFISGSDNLIEDNTIAGNAGFGIYMHDFGTVRNTVTHNAIYSHTNEGAGISLNNGANDYMFPPLLTEVSAAGVKGVAVPSSTVEVFSDDEDEGRWYHGSTVAGASGAFTFTVAVPFTGTNVTATATDQDGNTSEFSSPYHPSRDILVAAVYVPQPRHQVAALITPTVRVGNGGTAAESFTITAVITRGSGGVQVYSATQVVMDLSVFHYRTLALSAWTPLENGNYTFEVVVQTGTPDDAPANDRLTLVFVVADYSVDVWARDNLTDDGREPSVGPVWQSPDVWVRNVADGGTTHQDPINAITNTVYLTVRNWGTLTATDVVATVYWHPPALVIGQSWWQSIDTVMLAELAPGATQVVSMSWPLDIAGLTGSYHTCLLGVLTSTEDLPPVVWDVRGSNNLIQRNVDVIPQREVGGETDLDLVASSAVSSTFDVGNPYPGEQLVDVLVDASGVPVGGELWIDLGRLYKRWEQVGRGSLVGAAPVSGTTVITVAGGTQAEITGIPMAGEELAEIVVEIYGLDGGQSTQIDVSERIGGDVLGGITLEVTAIEYKVYLPLVLRDH